MLGPRCNGFAFFTGRTGIGVPGGNVQSRRFRRFLKGKSRRLVYPRPVMYDPDGYGNNTEIAGIKFRLKGFNRLHKSINVVT
jgi:hypothetical protein